MADSGIVWIDFLFNLAVRWLYTWAEILGVTYEEINVWIFVVSWPCSLAFLCLWVIILKIKIKALKKKV